MVNHKGEKKFIPPKPTVVPPRSLDVILLVNVAIVGAPPKFNVGCCCCSCVEPAAGIVVADTFELAPKVEAETEEENNEVGLLVAVAAAAGAVAAAPKENPDAVA